MGFWHPVANRLLICVHQYRLPMQEDSHHSQNLYPVTVQPPDSTRFGAVLWFRSASSYRFTSPLPSAYAGIRSSQPRPVSTDGTASRFHTVLVWCFGFVTPFHTGLPLRYRLPMQESGRHSQDLYPLTVPPPGSTRFWCGALAS
jgi:hypothetical protein